MNNIIKKIISVFNIIFNSKYKTYIHLGIIAFLGLAVYSSIFPNKFVWDDYDFILRNQAIRSLSLESIFRGELPKGHEGVWRPFRTAMYSISFFAWGLSSVGYRIQAVILHICISFLIYFLARKITGIGWGALFIGCLFVVHPVNTESVSFATASFDLFTPFFYFSSLLAFLAYKDWRRGISYFLFVLALLSGEMAITFPFALWLILWKINYKESFRERTKKIFPYLVLLFIYFIIRFFILDIQSRGNISNIPQPLIWILMTKAILHYLEVIFIPIRLTVLYVVFPPGMVIEESRIWSTMLTFIDAKTAIFIFILIFSIPFFIYLRKKTRSIMFVVLWFFITLFPVLNIIPTNIAVAERYVYIPLFGILLGCFEIIRKLISIELRNKRRLDSPFLIPIFCIAIILFFSIRSIFRNFDWKDSITLWKNTTESSPLSSLAWNNLGVSYVELNDKKNAERAFEKASSMNKSNIKALSNMAFTYFENKEYEKAEEAFMRAVSADTKNVQLYINLAKSQTFQKKYKEAENTYLEALEIFNDPDLYNQYGVLLMRSGDIKKAKENFQKSLSIDPKHIEAINNYAVILMSEGDWNNARKFLEKTNDLVKDDPDIYYNLGQIYEHFGDEKLSQKMYKEALRVYPEHQAKEKIIN